jgi:hypothetical protein
MSTYMYLVESVCVYNLIRSICINSYGYEKALSEQRIYLVDAFSQNRN